MLTQQDMAIVRRMIGQAMNSAENVDNVRRDFYVYESEAIPVVSGQNVTDTINIEADSDFMLQKLTYFADIGTGLQTAETRVLPLVTVQLTDTGSGRQLMQNPIPIPALFGTGELPYIIPNPRKFLRNSTIQINYINYAVAPPTDYNIRLAFHGYKIYETA